MGSIAVKLGVGSLVVLVSFGVVNMIMGRVAYWLSEQEPEAAHDFLVNPLVRYASLIAPVLVLVIWGIIDVYKGNMKCSYWKAALIAITFILSELISLLNAQLLSTIP